MTTAVLKPPHITEAANGEILDSALAKLGGFLAEKKLTGVFGARTLHSHFGLADNEAMLDRADADGTVWTRVVSLDEASGHQPVEWGFFPNGDSVVLSWSADAQGGSYSEAMLAQVGAFLAREGLTCVLAIGLLGDPVAGGKVLLELTDKARRVQWTRAVSAGEVDGELPAGWSFSETGKAMPGTWCSTRNCSHD